MLVALPLAVRTHLENESIKRFLSKHEDGEIEERTLNSAYRKNFNCNPEDEDQEFDYAQVLTRVSRKSLTKIVSQLIKRKSSQQK